MTPERWKQIDELAQAALDRDADEREAFLDEACSNDDALRREVESQLAYQQQASKFLEEPAFKQASDLNSAFQTESESMLGRTIAHWIILSKLGAGGMGEVYLAQDTRLKRRVALKLLPVEFTRDPDRVRRFELEAQAASALSHPNIVTIHEIGEIEGAHYIVTEYVAGQTLRARMTSEQMTLAHALEIVLQIASALTVAHEARIIHRDIKPENVMLRDDGLIKVLDFGLAKLTGPTDEAADTQAPTELQESTATGVVLGTAAYMSPEQARGLKVDSRTDIFSLGVLLYELITGQKPFQGATTSDVIVAILEREPPPMARFAREVPEAMEWIVSKALAKDQEQRYQTVKDLALDLRGLKRRLGLEAERKRAEVAIEQEAAAVPDGHNEARNQANAVQPVQCVEDVPGRAGSSTWFLPGKFKRHKVGVSLVMLTLVVTVALLYRLSGQGAAIDSLAVLPFVNVGADPNTEYLSDGITESLISSLAQLAQLKVRSRDTVFRYKGRETDEQTVGRELGVRAVLKGRVVPRGNDLSISVELVDARDGNQLWGAQYPRKLADLQALQEEMVREITEKLRLRLSGAEQEQLAKRATENPEAYQLYLNARSYANFKTPDGNKQAIEYYQKAIALDPRFARAYAGLALSTYGLGESPREQWPKAEAAVKKALELDDKLGDAHATLAALNMHFAYDWVEVEQSLRLAMALNPREVNTLHWYSHYLTALGRHPESLSISERALELEPTDLFLNAHLGWQYIFSRQIDKAIVQLEKTREMNPNFLLNLSYLGMAYEQAGRFEDAIAALNRAVDLSKRNPTYLASLGRVFAVAGRRIEAKKILDDLHQRSKQMYVPPYGPAIVHAGLGEKDQAFLWLNRAYEDRNAPMVYLKVNPLLDNLRSDPRFAELLQRVGLSKD